MEISLIVAIIGIVIGLAGVGLALWQKARIDKVLRYDGRNLEAEIKAIESKLDLSEHKSTEIEAIIKEYIQLGRSAIQKIGFQKFDAYEDMGGSQSFVLALLDFENNGVIISSIHNRAMTRMYGKRIIAGKADVELAKEEEAVLADIIKKVIN
jgi:hypothetical protein